MKELFGGIAIVLSIVGYIPYLKDIRKGKTKPHAYSWLIWSILSFVVFFAQLSRGAGYGTYFNFVTGLISLVILYFGFKKGEKNFTVSDKFALTVGLVAIPIWLITKEPFYAILIATFIDVVAFWPTIRKTWLRPHSETWSSFLISGFKYLCGVLAIQSYSKTTLLYPLVLVFINFGFVSMIFARIRSTKGDKHGT